MRTLQPVPPVKRSLGSVRFVERRNAYEIRVRDRHGVRRSSYIAGPESADRRLVAERALVERLAELERGARPVGRRMTVGAWLDEWLELASPGLKSGSRQAYADRIKLYLKPELGRHRLADLEAIDVSRAMARIAARPGRRGDTLAPGTVDAAYRTLAAALQVAYEQGKAPRNAARGATVTRPTTRIEPPTIEELDRLEAELVGDPYEAVFSLMRWTGARRGEALGLEWRYVDLEARTVAFVSQASGTLKSGRPRRVGIPQHVADELARIPRRIGSPLVFSTSSGRPIDPRNVNRHYDAALMRAGIAPDLAADLDKYRPHDLRHAFATMLLEAGAAPTTVQAWLGHASLAMLDRYAHVKPRPGGAAYLRVVAVWGDDADAILPALRHRSAVAL